MVKSSLHQNINEGKNEIKLNRVEKKIISFLWKIAAYTIFFFFFDR